MSKRPLKVLLVESDDASSERLQSFLRTDGGGFDVERVTELSEALAHLSRGGTDVAILNLELPDSQGLVSFERMWAFAPTVPVVVVTGEEDEDLALASVQGGAQDFLVHPHITPAVLARSLRYAVERHRLLYALRSLSLIDDLTGLYNRRGFGELGEQYLRMAWRSGNAVTLMFLDVDRFKDINDSHGHHVGDRALLAVAEILRSNFRSSDLIARVGGDEFAVLAPETAEESPETLVRRVRGAVEKFNTTTHEPYRLSVSMGVARFGGEAPPSLEDLLAQADTAMYEDKRTEGVLKP